jgi:hypothetical protein
MANEWGVMGVFARLLDPILRLWSPLFLIRAGIASGFLPKPTDDPAVVIPGPDPDRLLMVGGGIAVGFGVLSHQLGLAGHLARQVSAATGRGAEVDILAQPDLTMGAVPELLVDTRLSNYDAIVLVVGVTDALKRTPTRLWRRRVDEVIDIIRTRTAAGTHVFVVGVQPVRLVTTLNNRVGLLAEFHARLLNRESARACAETLHATFVPFSPDAEPGEHYRSTTTYGKWASLLSPAVVDLLERNHPLGDFAI